MTTTIQSEGNVIDDTTPFHGPCPYWCTLPPGHPVDSLVGDDQRPARGHGDVPFGAHLVGGADEYGDTPGIFNPVVQINADGINVTDPRELIIIAADMMRASIWLTERLDETK